MIFVPPDHQVVQYSCSLCGIEGREVVVRYREPGENIRSYMKGVILTIGKDHMTTSPRCGATSITEIKIRLSSGAEGIGEAPES